MEKILDKYKEEDLVKNYKIDGNNIQFEVDLIEQEFEVNIDISKEPFQFHYDPQSTTYEVKTKEEAFTKMLTNFHEKRQKFIDLYEDKSSPKSPNQNIDMIFDDSVPKEESQKILDIFLKDFKELQSKLEKGEDIAYFINEHKSIIFRIAISSSWLNIYNADALQIDRNRRLIVDLDFNWKYIHSSKPPSLYLTGIYQSSDSDLSEPTLKDKYIDFKVLKWFLSNRVINTLTKLWTNKEITLLEKKQPKVEEKKGFFSFLFGSKPKKKEEVVAEKTLTESGNILIGLLTLVKSKFLKCCNNCIICDDTLGYTGLKPSVCDKELCIHCVEQYGLGIDIVSEVKKNQQVLDLLVTLTSAGAQLCVSSGGVRDLSPFPEYITDGKNDFKDKTHDAKAKKVLSVIDKLPPIKDIAKEKDNMKQFLDEKDTLLFPLFRWIITSNRTHLMPVPEKLRIKELDDNVLQYVMLSSNPEREAVFRSKREKYGSLFAFHGSHTGNWHAILRHGLKNLSNTSKMSAGAAHGSGIYLAPELSTSIGYMVIIS